MAVPMLAAKLTILAICILICRLVVRFAEGIVR